MPVATAEASMRLYATEVIPELRRWARHASKAVA
jgi:hypothetical protein